MPPKQQKKPPCKICNSQESKYTCSKCMVPYCSVACYKTHKEGFCATDDTKRNTAEVTTIINDVQQSSESEDLSRAPDLKPPSPPLRLLTSLKWPYIPEEPAYPDPLKRDDPKPLQLHQFEAIATSTAIRHVIAEHPRLRDILRNIDQLRGEDRQDALQRALGVSTSDGRPPGINPSVGIPGIVGAAGVADEEDVLALRELAEAVEAAVRAGKEDVLGLDWGD
ncbi:unnamed protein product [Somion occarium]|uniref:HIT-type domain-containing protein n=1 Tax=Somion occarium TaxID=3059160 RepID=A0ABP1DFX3_9APHY